MGIQPEVDSAFGARLREACPGTLELLTMVNGAQKYLPSSEAYDRITYEAMNSGLCHEGADEVLGLWTSIPNASSKEDPHMNIGCARRKLTPQTEEVYLIGYRNLENRLHPATGIYDDVFGNALYFEQDGQELFVLSCDFMEIDEGTAEDAKTLLHDRYGISRDCVLLCATHNHTTVVAYHRTWWTGKFDQEYYDWYLETVASAFEECRANARPATCRLGRQWIEGFYNNRITNEPADQEVTVVKFFDKATGEAFAGLVNWASHSATCGQAETRMNSEFAGMTSKKLEPSFGFFPAMIVGAAGDCSNRNLRQGTGVEEAERISSGIAPLIAAIPVETEVPLNGIRVQTVHHIVHNEKGEEVALCSVISLGGLHLFVSPCEFGGKFGIQMREACPVEGLVFGYTNGYLEYWLPEEEYGLSFETQKSMVPKGDPEILVGKLIQASQLLGR